MIIVFYTSQHTIEGKMVYSPILIRLQCGEHPEYTELHDSRWMDFGFGMISIYKSDWERVGGKNKIDSFLMSTLTIENEVTFELTTNNVTASSTTMNKHSLIETLSF